MKINQVLYSQNQSIPVFGKKRIVSNPFKRKDDTDSFIKNETEKPEKKSFFKRLSAKTKMCLSAIAGAVVSGLAVFAVLGSTVRSNIQKRINAEYESSQLRSKLDSSQREVTDGQEKNAELKAEIEKVKSEKEEQKAELKQQIERIQKEKEELNKAIKNISKPGNFDELVTDKTLEISAGKLDYNPIELPVIVLSTLLSSSSSSVKKVPMSEKKEQTNNRADMKVIDYPVYNPSEPYHFKFPETDAIKTTENRVPFKEQPLKQTTISEAYADSLNWDNGKISRDLMQNFYDGHGQTLDGVSIDIVPTGRGNHKVKISGKSVYSPDKAILLGESTKKDDPKAAGNFGEGLKMVVLKLLKEKGADNVNISSDNWSVNYKFADSEIGDKRVLSYELKKADEPVDGNYIEFETNDDDLIKSILDTYDNFYHSSNTAFKCPNFENSSFGITLLDKQAMGRIFIAGQAFEVNGQYLGCKGANVFIKEKPPVKYDNEYIFDPSRDRTSLNDSNIKAIANWLAQQRTFSDTEKAQVVHTLEDYWSEYVYDEQKSSQLGSFLDGFINGLATDSSYFYNHGYTRIKFDFPEYCVADAYQASPELKKHYMQSGYRICKGAFERIGMRSLNELVNDSRKHKPLEPTEKEKNKILILKDALKLLSPALSGLFSEEELNPQIYIFDNSASNEDVSAKNTNAEAIVDKNKSLGFWIDRKHLKKDFPTVLATELHELTHKYGGDETMEFSYKLTDVLQSVLSVSTDNLYIATQLKVLEEAWKAQQE